MALRASCVLIATFDPKYSEATINTTRFACQYSNLKQVDRRLLAKATQIEVADEVSGKCAGDK